MHIIFSWQASYTLAHSVDDASVDFSVESVNDPPASQNIFDRKGSRGPSDFDIRHNFVANAVYELPGRGRLLGGWQVSAVANVHSGVPFTPVLALRQCRYAIAAYSGTSEPGRQPLRGCLSEWGQSGHSVMLV